MQPIYLYLGSPFILAKYLSLITYGGVAVTATLAAFIYSFISATLMKKITLKAIQITVGIMLIVVGRGMATGFFEFVMLIKKSIKVA